MPPRMDAEKAERWETLEVFPIAEGGITMAQAKVLSEITVETALEILKEHGSTMMGRKMLCAGIKSGALPFGICVEIESDRYIVYENQLLKWLDERMIERYVPEIPKEEAACASTSHASGKQEEIIYV